MRIDHSRAAVVADVARTEDAYRQSSRSSRPDKPFRHPLGLVVTSLHPVHEGVYLAVFQVGGVVSSREDAIGRNVLNWFCCATAGELEHLQCSADGVGLSCRIRVGLIDRRRAMEYQVDLFRQTPVIVIVQSHPGLGEVSSHRDDPVSCGMIGQPVKPQGVQHAVGGAALP